MGIAERKEREKSRKREVILKSAEEIFFKNGFEKTTMDEIAEKAEYSKGTLYLYFKNKDALYAAIMLRSVDIFTKILDEEISKVNGGRAKLNAIKTGYLKFYRAHPDHLKVFLFAGTYMMQMQKEDIDAIMTEIIEKNETFKRVIFSAIETAAKDGTLEEMGIPTDVETVFQAGGFVLNGIFKNMIDHEKVFQLQNISPDVLVNLAFGMLRF